MNTVDINGARYRVYATAVFLWGRRRWRGTRMTQLHWMKLPRNDERAKAARRAFDHRTN